MRDARAYRCQKESSDCHPTTAHRRESAHLRRVALGLACCKHRKCKEKHKTKVAFVVLLLFVDTQLETIPVGRLTPASVSTGILHVNICKRAPYQRRRIISESIEVIDIHPSHFAHFDCSYQLRQLKPIEGFAGVPFV